MILTDFRTACLPGGLARDRTASCSAADGSGATDADRKVYLVTATAPDAQWKEVSPKLIACVDSFKVEPGK